MTCWAVLVILRSGESKQKPERIGLEGILTPGGVENRDDKNKVVLYGEINGIGKSSCNRSRDSGLTSIYGANLTGSSHGEINK